MLSEDRVGASAVRKASSYHEMSKHSFWHDDDKVLYRIFDQPRLGSSSTEKPTTPLS